VDASARAHGGRVTAANRGGSGAIVTVSVPVDPVHAQP
jgi:hypothetical protein